MSSDPHKHNSKFLSLILRHQPEKIGLQLDPQGWASITELLDKCAAAGKKISREELLEIVRTNDKQRFALNADQSAIRASQGHSVEVSLDLPAVEPPDILYHGTVQRFMEPILTGGLQKMDRMHVHLSADLHTATQVGSRRGKPVILLVRSGDMHRQGHVFHLSDNGVWLTDAVPPQFLEPFNATPC
ncbi:RNA 2'-phosphotransferase [Chitinophaga deserti]|uniref:RNA 2'-phosphotransferase n=1 Tax=Chitinophaga deserti TaxID=2164099 RepID=UPI000D6B8EA2|nr:RNA 2'-phosphotransferase [Chitinophaga deserti]